MNKNFLIAILSILLFPFNSFAQKELEDVVYLKNESIIHGTIIEQVPNQTIKIQTKDGNVFVYKIEEIQKITKEETKGYNRSKRINFTNNEIKQSGYTNITELSLGFGQNTNILWGIQTVNGYQINPNLNIGFGLGIDKYQNATYLPIFADFRINFLSTTATPFFAAAGGYSFGFENNLGGLLLNPALGVKYFVSPKSALNFSIGYRYQENKIDFSNYYYNYIQTYKQKSGLINLKIGATF